MKPLVIITFLLTLCSCLTPPQPFEPSKQFYQAVERHFNYIDSVRKIDPDLVESENIQLQQTINLYKADILSLDDTSDYDLLYIAKSADKKLCLVSWDTRMGGTMIDFATMAIYQNSAGDTISTMLIDTSKDPMSNTLIHYDNLYSVKATDKIIYIANGWGQGSTILPWQELRAFEIDDTLLNDAKIFPEKQSTLFIEFDVHNLKREEIPMIQVIDSARIIAFPIPTDDGGFSGKYERLIFRNGTYLLADSAIKIL